MFKLIISLCVFFSLVASGYNHLQARGGEGGHGGEGDVGGRGAGYYDNSARSNWENNYNDLYDGGGSDAYYYNEQQYDYDQSVPKYNPNSNLDPIPINPPLTPN